MKYKTLNSRTRLAKSIKLASKILPETELMALKPFEVEEVVYSVLASHNYKVKKYFNKWDIKYSPAINSLKIL